MNGPSVAVVGGGPAGLRAAEIIARHGIHTTIFEQKASPGRKFLVAGRGGLNITHSESLDKFASRYDLPERWAVLLERFSPRDLREWFGQLGVETFLGTSGRVFPRNIRTPMVLELWLERLDALGCDLQIGRRFHQMLGSGPYDLVFQRGTQYQLFTADSVLFALGGASWPQTGSDALWVEEFHRLGIHVTEFVASNVGWECQWSEQFLQSAEGKPLKNLEVSCCGKIVAGELMVTEYGLEGGAIYQLTRELRHSPQITIDFKPELSVANPKTLNDWMSATKASHVQLERPRSIEEAISSAGGVPWEELDEDLMLRRLPGVFCAGEMIDWEAPTGGYLLQGCFVTATIAGEGIVKWIAKGHQP